MMIALFMMTVIALVLTNATLLVVLLLRLAEEHRDIADMRSLHDTQRRRNPNPPAR